MPNKSDFDRPESDPKSEHPRPGSAAKPRVPQQAPNQANFRDAGQQAAIQRKGHAAPRLAKCTRVALHALVQRNGNRDFDGDCHDPGERASPRYLKPKLLAAA